MLAPAQADWREAVVMVRMTLQPRSFSAILRFVAAFVALGLLIGAVPVATRPAAAQSMADFSLPWTPPAEAYRITAQADGLYALTYSDLAAAGLPVDTLDPRSLRLYAMGAEVPIRVPGEDDAKFDAQDVLLFYGRSIDSLFLEGLYPTNKYTGTAVYWLTAACPTGPCDSPRGLRMSAVDGSGSGASPEPFAHREHIEKGLWYFSSYPFEPDADHWYSDWVTPAVPRTYSFYAYNLPSGASAATLKLDLLGWSKNAHHLRVWVNNTLVLDGSPSWSDFTKYATTVSVASSLLVEGQNRVKIGIVLDPGVSTDTVYLNWLDITYRDSYAAESGSLAFGEDAAGPWRYTVDKFATAAVDVYDVGDPFAPRLVTNTAIDGAGPYAVTFASGSDGPRKYLAVESSAWRKPASIEKVTRPSSPYAVADLRDVGNRADYILITHGAFWQQAGMLAAHRAGDMRAVMVDIQQIYDQFNGGVMSAESIRDFLAYTHAHWTSPAPAYVLLFGDGTYDMRKYRSAYNTYLPPFLAFVDPDMGETAAENRFVVFEGADNLPDMSIGRFPVNTAAQAQTMVDKTIAYERDCECGAWNTNTLFVSDDLEGGGGSFYYYSDQVADGYADPPANTVKFLPEYYNVKKAYLGQTCDVTGNPSPATQCREEITSTLNLDGALFVSYIGHSTKEYWAAEHLLDKLAVASLSNSPCLPVALAMTCYEGAFHDADTDVLAEASVRQPGGGMVASFSPTGFGLAPGHDYLEKGIFTAWFHEGISHLGPSADFAKQYLDVNAPPGEHRDLIDTFTLLGDPALKIKTVEACLSPTAVEMVGFSARQELRRVRLEWETADESDVLGFNVLRQTAGAVEWVQINRDPILAARVGAMAGESYFFYDADVAFGQTYRYMLEIIRLDGAHERFGFAEARLNSVSLFVPFAQQP
jgi:hypothetical protein